MSRRRPWRVIALICLVGAMALVWNNRADLEAFPDIIGAYSAKEYCSCRYVVGNPAEYCSAYVKQWLPLNGFVDDPQVKRVTATGLGRSHAAQWLSVREGCQLMGSQE